MEKRIVRVEDGFWRIRTELDEITAQEQNDLIEYFNEIRFPYQIISKRLCVPDAMRWADIRERLEHFYDGWAEVYPF